MAKILDIFKQGIKRVKATPLKEFFLPTSQSARTTLKQGADLLSKTPKVVAPPTPKVKNPTLQKVLNIASVVPKTTAKGADFIAESYLREPSRRVSKLASGQKLTGGEKLSTALDISSVIPTVAIAGRVKRLFDAGKTLKAEGKIRDFLLMSKDFDLMRPNAQMQTITDADDILKEVLPSLAKSKEMKLLSKNNPREWLNTVSKFAEDALVEAKNPGLNLGLSTSPLKKLNPSVEPSVLNKTRPVIQRFQELQSELKMAPPQLLIKGQKFSTRPSISDLPEAVNEISQSAKNLKPSEKVNFLDYVRTPDRVLNKIGLGKEAELLKKKYRDYVLELPKEINKVTEWSKRAPDVDSSKRIFQYLDGQKVQLPSNELKIAGEIKKYLSQWADKLGLPKDNRIASYITHLFDEDFIQKEFDPDIAKLIDAKVPGSVYDPFLQQRLGKLGYKEDAWQALDAYIKRGVRKFHMDQALGPLQKAADKLDLESYKYVQGLAEKVNLRPSHVDNLIDNLVKSSPVGYKLGGRPVARVSRAIRQAVYRGTLGLNVSSALRNLTQGANTYAKLGEKFTVKGYIDAFKDLLKNGDELKRVGVLTDDIVQDRTLNATKKFWENTDKGLFSLFELAERINRGSAYFGAKAKYLSQGLPEDQAIEKAINLVEQTQFKFGSVDTPLALQNDIGKIFTQFQSFNVKQTEFLTEMLKNKDIAGGIRWTGASLVMLATIGKLFGMDLKDLVPFSGILSGETKLGETPPIQAAGALGKIVFGGDEGRQEGVSDLKKVFPAFIPAGVQAKKTIEGITSFNKGGSYTPTGRERFTIEKTPVNLAKSALFGQYSTEGADDYFKNFGKSKGVIEYEKLKKLPKEDANNELDKIQEENPQLYKSVQKEMIFDELKATKEERRISKLTVSERAKSVAKEINKIKSKEEKNYLLDRYEELGILTESVSEELTKLHDAGKI